MLHLIKIYVITAAAYVLIDFIWLGVIMSGFYKSQLGLLARRVGESLAPIWWAAIIVYLIVPIGIIIFVLPKVAGTGSIWPVILWGFLFGVITYGVYDLTNYAILKDWPVKFMVVDILWGGVVCAIISYIAAFANKLLS